MSQRPPRGVLFDLDNTLILEDASTLAAVRAAAEAAAERARLDVARLTDAAADAAERAWKAGPSYEYADAFGIWWGEALWGEFNGPGDELARLRAFVPSFRASVWRHALAAVGLRDDALASAMSDTYISVRRSKEEIDPDAVPVLSDLARDHRLALVTNGASDVQREKLSRTPFARLFEDVVISGEVGVGKPDPRLFEIAARRIGLSPSATTMIGDSLVRDIAGAQRAGLRAVWVDRGLWREEGVRPDATVTRLHDLRAALDALERRAASPPAIA